MSCVGRAFAPIVQPAGIRPRAYRASAASERVQRGRPGVLVLSRMTRAGRPRLDAQHRPDVAGL